MSCSSKHHDGRIHPCLALELCIVDFLNVKLDKLDDAPFAASAPARGIPQILREFWRLDIWKVPKGPGVQRGANGRHICTIVSHEVNPRIGQICEVQYTRSNPRRYW
jgi:hypothetical protein